MNTVYTRVLISENPVFTDIIVSEFRYLGEKPVNLGQLNTVYTRVLISENPVFTDIIVSEFR
ncbi:MAG TPA: hypothetical protein PLQ09_01355, partial [Prolixibacteraceae bacterium]|nr:hypothetical protein [Prolixibacteraceae bacterium]